MIDGGYADEDEKNKDLFRMSDDVVLEGIHQLMFCGLRQSLSFQ